MRGEASRIADRVSRDSLAPKLRDSGEDAWRIGNELFTITNVLDHNIQLERALTDPSRPVEDKVAVVKTLIGDDAHPLTMEIMSDLVARRWSRVSDIANAAEDFGVDGMMYYADHTNATLQVSIELAQLHSALLNLPVVRSKLYDATVPAEARIKLLYSLIGNADFSNLRIDLSRVRDVTSEALGSVAELAGGGEAAAKAAEPIYWNYGAFIQQCVDFAILAFCVFLMVKLMNRLMKKRAATPPAPPAPSKEELLLTEIRDLLRERQADGR